MIVNTHISYGHRELLKIFFKANELDVTIQDMSAYEYPKHAVLYYEDESDTATAITYMSLKHLGFENMLCDYLIRCDISPSLISIGNSSNVKRDMKQIDIECDEHLRRLGFKR